MGSELEIATRNQQRLWVRVIGHLERLDGRPFRAFGSVQNVHSQKLAQIALETRTEWLTLSMNMAAMRAWRWERATDLLEFAMVGAQVPMPGPIAGMKKLLARVHPKDRPAVSH